MFYSHQLLSKKHPMGQIWIAATVRLSINRKKAAKINIEQICQQILNPPVPLALRLSGILMGGIVHIYDRKVRFLYEDMNAFLMKINVDATRRDVDRTTLPKRKFRAKYENITMASDGFHVSENIERPMRQSSIPLQDGENTLEETFFVFPGNDNGENFEDNTSPRDQFQAAVEDITLQDNAPYSGGWRNSGSAISADSILGPMDDFLPEFQLPGQMTTPNFSPAEHCVPDPIIPDNIPPDLSGALHTIFEDQLPEPETNTNNVILAEAISRSQLRRETVSAQRSLRKKKARVLMYDDDTTEISKKMFTAWLEDRSDIVGGRFVRQVEKINKQRVAAVQQNWGLPSVCVSLNVKHRPGPTWAPPLQEMWRLATSTPTRWKKRARFGDTATSPPSSGSKQINSPIETGPPQVTDIPGEKDILIGGDPNLETDLPSGADFPMETDLRTDPEDLLQSPPQSLGSVEKLRAALQTPNTGSHKDTFGNKFSLRTPALFAPLNTGGSSKRSMSASHGGSLSYDSEGEPPTSGKSKRSRHSSVKGVGRSMSPISGELPEMNFPTRRASDKSDMIDYFASGDFQAAILTQSQLLEDTSASTQKLMPADSINTTTIVLAKLLREHFDKLKIADISEASIFNLTSRLDKTQAARMFYQICVLASNESITVKQAEPYGDIILKRGVTL
ncbi:hypothetical protein M758_5G051000 [Ceratodon purpureus]|nr:hypothetical protein M758_5G051000 [Ceratodon purpureus]KAG0615560.1 hypothetical protein M758_5G051000 [Ceratodon purpureus]